MAEYKLNFPIVTPEAYAFWESRHKLNRIKAIIAFSLDLDNANDNLRRAGYYRQYRKKYLDLYNCYVAQPDMTSVPFSDLTEYWWDPTAVCGTTPPTPIPISIITNTPLTGKIGDVLTFSWAGNKKPFLVTVEHETDGTIVDKVVYNLNTYSYTTTKMGKYKITVEDSDGDSIVSNETDIQTVVITTQPADFSGTVGDVVTYSIIAHNGTVGDTAGLTYQWQASVDEINWANVGTSSPNFSSGVSTAPVSNAWFRCIVTNSNNAQSVESRHATLTITAAGIPVITTQPQSQDPLPNTQITLSVVAVNGIDGTDAGLTYQWQYRINTTNAWSTGGTTRSFDFDSGGVSYHEYRVIVTNAQNNTVTSDIAIIRTRNPLVISTQPTYTPVKVGQAIALSAVATGGYGTVNWKWQKGGVDVASASGTGLTATLNIASAATTDNGDYTAVFTDDIGSVTSNIVTVTVTHPAPVFSDQPSGVLDSTLAPNVEGKALFQVGGKLSITKAAVTGTVTDWRWEQSADGSTGWTVVAGQTNSDLIITNAVKATHEGYYRVSAKNGNSAWVIATDVIQAVCSFLYVQNDSANTGNAPWGVQPNNDFGPYTISTAFTRNGVILNLSAFARDVDNKTNAGNISAALGVDAVMDAPSTTLSIQANDPPDDRVIPCIITNTAGTGKVNVTWGDLNTSLTITATTGVLSFTSANTVQAGTNLTLVCGTTNTSPSTTQAPNARTYSIKSAGTTGATLAGAVLSTTAVGTVVVTAHGSRGEADLDQTITIT